MDIREMLAAAGKQFDGHVTNGSLAEQMKVVGKFQKVLEVLADIENYGAGKRFITYSQVVRFANDVLMEFPPTQ